MKGLKNDNKNTKTWGLHKTTIIRPKGAQERYEGMCANKEGPGPGGIS